MATVKSSTLTCLIHQVLRQPKLTSPVCLFLGRFSVNLIMTSLNSRRSPLPRLYNSLSHSFSSLLIPKPFSSVGESQQGGSDRTMVSMNDTSALKLSVKEKKKLASYAHSLGDKLKCQLVGKSGVTDSVISSFIETLEKNEFLKVKIHKTCPGELQDMILHLEEATGSVAVGQIARTAILYCPSPTKSKAEEKENTR